MSSNKDELAEKIAGETVRWIEFEHDLLQEVMERADALHAAARSGGGTLPSPANNVLTGEGHFVRFVAATSDSRDLREVHFVVRISTTTDDQDYELTISGQKPFGRDWEYVLSLAGRTLPSQGWTLTVRFKVEDGQLVGERTFEGPAQAWEVGDLAGAVYSAEVNLEFPPNG
jgi:hypothetical protein